MKQAIIRVVQGPMQQQRNGQTCRTWTALVLACGHRQVHPGSGPKCRSWTHCQECRALEKKEK